MPELQHRIDEEIKKFLSELPVSPAELYEPIRYSLSQGGKRLRPLFVLTACDLFNGKIENAILPALAVELFHNFTLVHDDIIDCASFRRNRPTVFKKWNSSIAILSGDVMLVKAYQLIHKSKFSYDVSEKVLSAFNEMAVKVCEGQQWDLNYEQTNKISIPQYFKMIELKTAALFAASMKIGALIGRGSERNASIMYEFGKNTGIAFQLQDDLLDVYGEEKKFGKKQGGDILANKKTFLLLKTMELIQGDSSLKKELARYLKFIPKNKKKENEKINAVKSIYDEVNVRRITEDVINSAHKKATAALKNVSVSSKKKKTLLDLTTALLHREM